MPGDSIQLLIDGTFPDPDGGRPLQVPTRNVTIVDSLSGHESDLVKEIGFGGTIAVVSDPLTHEVCGARVERALHSLGEVVPIVLEGHPHADAATAERIRELSTGCDCLIAVGSGTINDLCKHVSALDGKPYAVFATAPSMNGYTSVNAAITVDGHKKSLPALAPFGVFIDLTVFAQAPVRMIRSGLGDSSCRATAQTDWLLSHHLLDTPYRSTPFVLLAEDEAGLLGEAEALVRGDLQAMRRLARTLVMSGFGMTICGGSQPASQGEHLISHYIDMMSPPDRSEAFHGEQIAVTTLTMAAIQHELLSRNQPPRLRPTAVGQDDVEAHFGPEIGAACWQEMQRKLVTPENVDEMNGRLHERWDRLREDIRAIALHPEELRRVLERAGAPTEPAAIDVSLDFYEDAVHHARELRDRYTFLDLAGDAWELKSRCGP